MKQKLYMVVGVPASGKSTLAKYLADNDHTIKILSSDELRGIIGQDEEDQSVTPQVFQRMKEETERFFSSTDFSPLIDATNISAKNRSDFFKIAKKFNKEIVVFYLPIIKEHALIRNNNRDRKVPEYVINRMLDQIDEPCYSEGIDKIFIYNQNV